MKQLLLVILAGCFALFLSTPARAQILTDPDPCFDASQSKSSYYECLADGPGGYGPGGGQMPPCLSCVTGDNGTGLVQSYCKDPNVYLPSWPQYSNCQAYQSFYVGPCGCPIYETGCTGTLCLRA